MMRRLLWLFCTFLLGLAACDSGEDEAPAQLRAINASGADPVEIYENLDLLTRVDTAEVSPYLDVEVGATLLEARPVDEPVLATPSLQVLLRSDSVYTTVVVGPVDDLGLLFLTDRRTTPSGGRASVRLLHAAPGIGLLDVDVEPRADDLDSLTVEDLAFTGITPYSLLPAGSYTVFIDETGGNADAAVRVDLAPGRRYLFAITDALDARTLRLVVAEK